MTTLIETTIRDGATRERIFYGSATFAGNPAEVHADHAAILAGSPNFTSRKKYYDGPATIIYKDVDGNEVIMQFKGGK